MKKLILLTLFILIISDAGNAQVSHLTPSQIKEKNIYKITTKSFTINKDKKTLSSEITYFFNELGLVERIVFNSKNNYKIIFYDKNNNPQKEVFYYDSVKIYQKDYEYDSLNILRTISSYNSNNELYSRLFYFYESGKIIKIVDSTDVKLNLTKYKYDSLDLKRNVIIKSKDNLNNEIYYLYNDMGYIEYENVNKYFERKDSIYWKSNISTQSYEYDSTYKLKEMQWFISEDNYNTFRYYYGENNLLIKWEKMNNLKEIEYIMEYNYFFRN